MNASDYRSDIDGLRAVAVIMVVLFHAGLSFPGGFVGVDVFFVISGFLITGIIARDLEAGRFSLVTFWDRRIRRILPPLLVMVVVTVFCGWLLFLPEDLKDLAKSAMSQAGMVANIYFWRTTGYFDGPADQKPLLHMWSLAVEEQFYLFFPLALMLVWKFCRRAAIPLLALFTLLSFLVCLYGTGRHPSATYYLLPTRAWELSAGAVLALLKPKLLMSPIKATGCGVLGLSAILFAGFMFSESTAFPGWAALLPCGGASLIIAAGNTNRAWPTRLLSIKPLVGIGLISYSLYLWHWPILVLSRYWAIEGLGINIRVILVLASVACGWFSWRFIESPFRVPRWNCYVAPRRVLTGALVCNLASILLFACFLIPDIQPWIPEQALVYASAVNDSAFLKQVESEAASRGDFPRIGDNNGSGFDILVWGDSHAMAVVPVIDQLCKEKGIRGVMATYSETAPLVNFVCENEFGLGPRARGFANSTVTYVRANHVCHVLLTGVWCNYSYNSEAGSTTGKFIECLKNTVEQLRDAGASVTIMLEVPLQNSVSTPKLLARQSILRLDVDFIGVPITQHRARVNAVNDEIRNAVGGLASILDPAEFLVNDLGFCPAQKAGKSIYRDNHHLSVYGAMQLADMFGPMIEQIANSKIRSVGTYGTTGAIPAAMDQ